MQTTHHGSLHSDLPEAVPKSDIATYKFSVPDRTPPFTTVHAFAPSAASEEPSQPPTRSRNLTSWPFLVLYGLLLAIVAGIAGGFIGKTIERNATQGQVSLASDSCAPSTVAPSAMPSPTPSSTPSSTVFERTLAQPTTGCDSISATNSFRARTRFLEWQYTTICGQGWLNDELIALSAATPSDCIEACAMYNAHKAARDRTCVGGGFIPAWWNQTRAMDESGGMAYNCFLKSNVSGIARNDKEYEVVALCVGGACDEISG